LTCIIQWSLVSLLLYSLNRVYLKYFHEKYKILEDGDHLDPPSLPIPHQSFPRSRSSVPVTPDDLPTYEEATNMKQNPQSASQQPVTLNSRTVSQKHFYEFHFWQKKWFFFAPKLDFFFGRKIWLFDPKIQLLAKNFGFWQQFRFLTRSSIFDRNFNFWPSFRFLFRLLTKNLAKNVINKNKLNFFSLIPFN